MKIKFNPSITNIPHDERYHVSIEKLFEIGAHFGHISSKRNQKMSPYVYKSVHGRDLIDMRQTHILLNKALNFIYEVAKKGGNILLFAPKPETTEYVHQIGEITGMNYVTSRWLGGLMTNFYTVNKSLNTLEKIESTLDQHSSADESGQVASYGTKKEILILTRQRAKLNKTLGGIKNMKTLPDVLILTDSKTGRTAINEAKKSGIPVISIVDTNSDLSNITCPIPMNDDADRVIRYFLYFVSQAVLSGKADGMNVKSRKAQDENEEESEKSES